MFRSIQTAFAALAGACTLTVIAALLLYALASGVRSQALVEERTRALIDGMVEQRVTALAQAQVNRIQAQLQAPLQIATSLARVHTLTALTGDDGMPMANLRREELINLARQTLIENPNLTSTYIAWEPNGVDANDLMYRGDEPGMLDGRFASWIYRDGSGQMKIDRLSDIEDTRLLDTGIRAGEYYLCPREQLKPCVGDPAPYDMNGQTYLLSSFNAPILVDGKFHGIVGADISVDFIQQLLSNANAQLYGGVGEIALISNNGRLAAYSTDKSLIGKPAAQILDAEEQVLVQRLPAGQSHYQIDQAGGHVALFLPFSFEGTDARWVLMLQLPIAEVMKDLDQLMAALGAESRSSLTTMLIIGVLIAVAGLLAIWLISRRITRPLRDMVVMLDNIGQGEGDLTQRLHIDSRNELGQIATGFNTFLTRLQGMISEVVGSVQKVSDASEHTADIAIRTDKGVQTQLAEIELVATAVHEMTATAQDVARNATQAAEAASHADRAANQGRHIVQDTGATITELAGEIGRAVDVVQTLARDSENI
ncbi:MAG TPA: methyl-accepting chemotaxis protein, partial [Pseudomonas sp.]|nr:methyl-accepting chemotaxis protein [Pseudomonas sp.]